MTRIRSPRELRIVVAHTRAADDAAGARFGQLLLQARQALIEPDREPPAGGDERDGEAGDERHDGRGDDDAPEPPRAQAQGPAPVKGGHAAPARVMPPPRPLLPAAAGNPVADHLAERIARFCSGPARARGGERWEVTVELDPAILPQTRLHLVLSDGTLSLRFDTRDAGTRRLICDNGAALRSRLAARLGAHIAVHVEVN
jgi:type III secretion control protein HpaP